MSFKHWIRLVALWSRFDRLFTLQSQPFRWSALLTSLFRIAVHAITFSLNMLTGSPCRLAAATPIILPHQRKVLTRLLDTCRPLRKAAAQLHL